MLWSSLPCYLLELFRQLMIMGQTFFFVIILFLFVLKIVRNLILRNCIMVSFPFLISQYFGVH